MSSDKPKRVRQILELALSLPPGERPGRLAEACDGDAELQHEIESLIDLYERSPRDASEPSPLSSPTTFTAGLSPSWILSRRDVRAMILARDASLVPPLRKRPAEARLRMLVG